MPSLLVGKRAKEMAAVAQGKGISYAHEDPFGLALLPFSLFAPCDGARRAENVLAAKIHGTRARGFDLPYVYDKRASNPAMPANLPKLRYDDGQTYGCAIAYTDASLPLLHVSPRGRRNQLETVDEVV